MTETNAPGRRQLTKLKSLYVTAAKGSFGIHMGYGAFQQCEVTTDQRYFQVPERRVADLSEGISNADFTKFHKAGVENTGGLQRIAVSSLVVILSSYNNVIGYIGYVTICRHQLLLHLHQRYRLHDR